MANITKTTALFLVVAVLFAAATVQGTVDKACYDNCYYKECMLLRTSTPEVCKEQCEPLCDSLKKVVD
uniref:Uncharacterized protein n=1 Tax=Kalanchoe fedtschenkoi TaxID=63787 RepID=A0A7N0REG4_KALFE